MASKQTSIFGPFIITAIGGITLGLIVMYFGYYQGRIAAYERQIAELQNKPTPDISFTFTVKEPSRSEKPLNREAKSSQKPSDTSVAVNSKPAAGNISEGTGATKRYDPAQTALGRPARSNRTQSASPAAQSRAQDRGPAFPKTQSRQPADDYNADDGSYSKPPPHIPDIDDPELDDNPLIRAIREASRRQAQNPQDYEYDDDSPRPNPFETILNIRTD